MVSGPDARSGLSRFEEELQQHAESLVTAIKSGNLAEAMDLIHLLHEFRHKTFFTEVGHLTRGLHEAIKAFSAEMGGALEGGQESIPSDVDAAERLNYVIDLSEKTAHETMDRVDTALSLVDQLDAQSGRFKDLLSLVGQLEAEHEGLRGVYDRTCALKEESEKTIDTLRTQLTDIVVSQSYQDISGQLIRRVITLVSNVETHLISLMDMAAKVQRLSGISTDTEKSGQSGKSDPIQAEGPQIRKESADIVSGQDEVDDLLSSLGF